MIFSSSADTPRSNIPTIQIILRNSFSAIIFCSLSQPTLVSFYLNQNMFKFPELSQSNTLLKWTQKHISGSQEKPKFYLYIENQGAVD